jgi:hypothetical protein
MKKIFRVNLKNVLIYHTQMEAADIPVQSSLQGRRGGIHSTKCQSQQPARSGRAVSFDSHGKRGPKICLHQGQRAVSPNVPHTMARQI